MVVIGPILFSGKTLDMHVLMPSATCKATAVNAINTAFRSLYHHGVWVDRMEARAIALNGIKFLQVYSELAWLAFRSRSKRFPMQPKFHYLNHTWIQMLKESDRSQWVLSPLVMAVQMQEDFIGKPARLSRRCNPRAVSHRVLQRSFAANRQCLKFLIHDQLG